MHKLTVIYKVNLVSASLLIIFWGECVITFTNTLLCPPAELTQLKSFPLQACENVWQAAAACPPSALLRFREELPFRLRLLGPSDQSVGITLHWS